MESLTLNIDLNLASNDYNLASFFSPAQYEFRLEIIEDHFC